MNEDDKDKTDIENKEEEVKGEENQSEGESPPNDTQSPESSTSATENNEIQAEAQSEVEEKKEHEVIHKKDGRLHIYVRQDKYKGELKSKNWVGRLYIDGKQKISSSGTPNLEDAIPILEKWFDDIHANKGKEEQPTQETPKVQTSVTPEQTTSPVTETSQQPQAPVIEKKPDPVVTQSVSAPIEKTEAVEEKTSSSILDRLKKIKLKKPSFAGSKEISKASTSGKNSFKSKLNNFFKSKLGKSTAQGEEIVGVEITNKEIRLAQISSNKANQWVLDKFFVHKVDCP